MEAILFQLIEWLQKGKEAVLVMILFSHGSTPRKAGAEMIVNDKETYGTIGGGKVEYHATQLARECLSKRQSMIKDYRLQKDDLDQLGMICGGQMQVAFQYFTKDDLPALQVIDQLEPCWYDLSIQSQQWDYHITCQKDVMHHDLPYYKKNADAIYFTIPIHLCGKVYLFGGGHIAKELCWLLSRLGFHCVVIENGEIEIDGHDYANAQIQIIPFEQLSGHLSFTSEDYAIIITRGHAYDATILAQVLHYPLAYIGMIGSHRKIEATYTKLTLENHYTQADFERVHAPIGLSIGAQTPEEIAIAICAEIIQVRNEHRTR